MIIVRFSDGSDWYKPNWLFHALAEDVVAALPEDVEVADALERAEAFGMLRMDSIDPGLSERLVRGIRMAAEAAVKGDISMKKKFPGDDEGRRMYLTAISELLELASRSAAQG